MAVELVGSLIPVFTTRRLSSSRGTAKNRAAAVKRNTSDPMVQIAFLGLRLCSAGICNCFNFSGFMEEIWARSFWSYGFQSGHDRQPAGANRRQKASGDTDDDGENHPLGHEPGGDAKTENQLTEAFETDGAGGAEPMMQKPRGRTTQDATEKCQNRAFDNEA